MKKEDIRGIALCAGVMIAVSFLEMLPVAVEGLAKALFAAFIFFACFAFSDTSPYDVVAIPTIVLWLCLGLRLHRGMVPLLGLLILYVGAITVAWPSSTCGTPPASPRWWPATRSSSPAAPTTCATSTS